MEPVLVTSLISALIPGAVEAVKGLFGAASRKWVGLSVDDQIKLQNADIERLKALATLDSPTGTPSQWVVDLRSSFRYLGAAVSILGGTALFFVAPDLADIAAQLVTIPFSFIFGERMVLTFKANKK
jgi:hypothetical protein